MLLDPGLVFFRKIKQARIDTEIRLTQAGDRGSKFNQPTFGSAIKNAKRAGYGQTQTAGPFHAFPFINEYEIGFEVQSQENCVML